MSSDRRFWASITWLAVAAFTLSAVSTAGAASEFGESGNVYDLPNDKFVLEATFVGRPGVRYSVSRTPTGTINVDDRDPFRFGPFVGCFLGERDQGRVVASGDSCRVALLFTNTSDRDITELQLDFSPAGGDTGPNVQWDSGRRFATVSAGESVVARLTIGFDEPVGRSANRFTASGSLGDDDSFHEVVDFVYTVKPAPPTVPQSVTTVDDGESLTVAWNTPLSAGGSDVTGYITRLRIEHPDWAAGISDETRWLFDELACMNSAEDRTCVLPNQRIPYVPIGTDYRFAVTAATELSPEGGYTFYTDPFDVQNPKPVGLSIADAASLADLVAASDYVPDLDAPILRFYIGYFNRNPDLAGAKYWLEIRRQGFSLNQIATFMADSPEFDAIYRGLSDPSYVAQVYQNVLGRPHDEAGYEYWLGLLKDRTLSRSAIVRWMTAGEEFVSAHRFAPADPPVSTGG